LPRTSVLGPCSEAPAAQPRLAAAATTKYAELRPNISHESDSRRKSTYQAQTTQAKATREGDFGGLGAVWAISSAPPREHFRPGAWKNSRKPRIPLLIFSQPRTKLEQNGTCYKIYVMAHHEGTITIKIFASEAPTNPKLEPKPAKINGTTTKVETRTPHKRRKYRDYPPTCSSYGALMLYQQHRPSRYSVPCSPQPGARAPRDLGKQNDPPKMSHKYLSNKDLGLGDFLPKYC
jgi:hypothetical protein